MRSTLLALFLSVLTGIAHAAAGDSISFNMVHADGATCLPSTSRGRVTVNDLGSVQDMHIEVFGLTPRNSFTTFITQHNSIPFGLSWYQGEIQTDAHGHGVGDFVGIFSAESFIVTDPPVQMDHIGIWFADPNDAANAGCSGFVTPFDGDHEGGILVLSTSNFPDNAGPLLMLK